MKKAWNTPVVEEISIEATASMTWAAKKPGHGHSNGNGHINGNGHQVGHPGYENGKGHHKDNHFDDFLAPEEEFSSL